MYRHSSGDQIKVSHQLQIQDFPRGGRPKSGDGAAKYFFTGRNEVLAKVIISEACVKNS